MDKAVPSLRRNLPAGVKDVLFPRKAVCLAPIFLPEGSVPCRRLGCIQHRGQRLLNGGQSSSGLPLCRLEGEAQAVNIQIWHW